MKFTTARYEIEVDEERAEHVIDAVRTTSLQAQGLYQFVTREANAVQRYNIPSLVLRGDLRHQQWVYFTTMTDRREDSTRVWPSHVKLRAKYPRLYTAYAATLKPATIESKLREFKVGSPGQSAQYWPRCAKTLFGELGGEPIRLYQRGKGLIDDVLAFKQTSKGGDPIPGFGPKILSLLALYYAELDLMPMPADAFPVDVHVQRFLISTGIVSGTGVIVNEQLERIARPLLCRVTKRLGISRIEASHDIWFLGHYACTGCWRNAAIPELCPAYAKCGGAIDSKSYYKKGVWHLDRPRNPRGGDVQSVLPWTTPIQAVA
ncbi:MAG: hypothetical protein ACEQSB_06320 [Undibacterium sp.]